MMTFILTPMTQVTQEVDFITCEKIPFIVEFLIVNDPKH